MGALISMCSCSSKGSTTARIHDSSTWYPQVGAHISIRTYRGLNRVQMSSPTWRRTETPSIGESFRSTDDLQEGDNRQPMTLTPRRLTAAVSQRLLM
ncbi:AC4 protein [Ludwigia yellow vein Vietnam virus]|uniref:AC4 protein n=1 Tax=Ludwigia yellow vein Vietnam virus TaxID=390444 RepID=A5H197_9GEMI|nr:AC4 protein [Ludwigia yellow vein Vietnam virus]ABG26058.1 AC4 protein [Ludwigia yellow vein Vietnam virus]